ncbi:MAG: Ig-like domain-containing protein [Bacteroidales bacterium]|nr:Ig-like domain-containing protein [Bacteroidales bacterium]
MKSAFWKFAGIFAVATLSLVACKEEKNSSGSDVPAEPRLETLDATDVKAVGAHLNAGLGLNGVSYSNLNYGFYWGSSEEEQDTFLAGGEIEDGTYSAFLSNLSTDTQYWYKAYVEIDEQTLWGEVKSFSTGGVPVNKVTLNIVYSPLAVGESFILEATVSPDEASDKTVLWTSSDESIATVDQSGNVTARSIGEATITATAIDGSGANDYCYVQVYDIVTPDAVDLGITVGGKNIKWASFNLGASKPEEYGAYYAWGETEPKSEYKWATYKWCVDGKYNKLTKYCLQANASYWVGDGASPDNKTEFSDYGYEDDAARQKLGGTWRMPTKEEWSALISDCTSEWLTENGVYGRRFTGSNGNSIFLPASGYRYNKDIPKTRDNFWQVGAKGEYWSSSLGPDVPDEFAWSDHAYSFSFDQRDSSPVQGPYVDYFDYTRLYGLSVRPVTE